MPECVVRVLLEDGHVEDGETRGRGQSLPAVLAADPDGLDDVFHPDAGVLILGLGVKEKLYRSDGCVQSCGL